MLHSLVFAKESVNLAILINNPDTLAITDEDALVNTDCQTLGEGELGMLGQATITTLVLTAGNTSLTITSHYLVIITRILNIVQLQHSPNLGKIFIIPLQQMITDINFYNLTAATGKITIIKYFN